MLAIIVVNYESEERTIQCVAEELTKITIPYLVVIVNNSSNKKGNNVLCERLGAYLVPDEKGGILKKYKIYVLPSNENVGFAKGNNMGFTFARKYFDIEYVLFANNDIVLKSENVVEKLINKINKLPAVGLIGPEIVGLDGIRQSPEPFIPFLDRFFLLYWLTPFLSKEKKKNRFKLDYSEKAEEGNHYKIMGAFFLMRAIDFESCKMMDTNTFLFSEEIILSERVKAIGKSAYFYPKVQILHEGGNTISRYLNDRQKLLAMFSSESYYYKNYIGMNSIQIVCARFSVFLYLLLKSIKIRRRES